MRPRKVLAVTPEIRITPASGLSWSLWLIWIETNLGSDAKHSADVAGEIICASRFPYAGCQEPRWAKPIPQTIANRIIGEGTGT